ncbi:valine--tRNA ligase [Roseicitreum antarcticum]|uniref:Valine--tRNA ligase n=1 Tax=Roseicitreum antarcticum TaxID=564137 RepID=A0A1H2VNE3_9RHOB|nr:valine--tRNA ligase [Roseicitreum antarcticum]SDW69484.1 valyl-tRNA synthetase [Roseicitreum antarcticum]
MPMEKTFDANAAESRIAAAWDSVGAFAAGRNARDGADSFSIMIPPPNVTGSLHMGHAFNNTLQDILVRWHRMRGFDTLWQPGQDHAGIATQMVVERELAKAGQRRTDFSREEFTAKIWEWKAQSGGTIINQLKRLGASCDWSRNAFTMSGAPGAPAGEDGNFHDAVIKVFVEMYNKGLIYRGKRLVNWDPHFETAISDLEVENVEVDGQFWHFKYPLAGGETYTYVERDADGNVVLEEVRDYIAIATTRPETMLGDGAVAVHPDDPRYAPIVGKMVHLPLCDRLIPIITDEYPDPDFGSGAVKITGAHDFNDYAVAKRGNIPCYRLMDTRGALRSDGGDYDAAPARAKEIASGSTTTEAEVDALNLVPAKYRGMDRFDARAAVVADIDALGLMIAVEDKKIMQPFGDRSKVVIEPMLTDQWFVDTLQIVQPAIDAVRDGRTQILPEQHEKVYFHWLENIEPWCISRQLWWGHQIPVWYDAEGKQYCAATEAEAQAMAGGSALTRDPDVLDTWFSSGLWPIGTLGWPEQTPELQRYFPTSVLITGFDIIFFWVARMMMMQLAVVNQEPFHTVYVHALVRDEKGKKMSKSLGNVLDPLDLIDQFGADAVRFTLTAMAAMGRDLKLSTARIEGYRNFGTKLWNATRFAEMNGVFADDVPQTATIPAADDFHTVNQWIIGETAKVRVEVDAALESYRFNDAANALYAFVWGKVCDWYVEFAKPLLADESTASETKLVMRWVLDQCYILLHPIMPFVTEELWGQTGARAKMLVHADWPTYGAAYVNPDADREMNWVISLIEGIRSARAQMRVPMGLKLPMLQVDGDDAAAQALASNAALVQRLARIDSITPAAATPKGAITVAVEGATFALPLEGVIDIAAEQGRLSKSLEKLEKELGGIRGRLNNPKFVDSAPEEVVAETREKLALGEEEAGRLSEALRRLAELA